jgi:uncharacterized protein (TIGR04222 family)
MSDAYTWGISGTSFLWLYAGLCVVTVVAVWLLRRRLLSSGAGAPSAPSLDVYELALLNGGPQLAITSAAAKLHNEESLAAGPKPKTIVADSRPSGGDELEHEVYSAVERTSGISSRALRRELERCATINRMQTQLIEAGMLLDDRRRAIVNSLWLAGVALLALGIARVVAGIRNDRPVTYLVFMLLAVAWATLLFARRRTRATARGRELLDAQRGGRKTIGHAPVGAEIPLAVALFGTGVLWMADPGIASAWAVPREHAWAGDSGGSGYSATSGCGGGGCGGGGCGG